MALACGLDKQGMFLENPIFLMQDEVSHQWGLLRLHGNKCYICDNHNITDEWLKCFFAPNLRPTVWSPINLRDFFSPTAEWKKTFFY